MEYDKHRGYECHLPFVFFERNKNHIVDLNSQSPLDHSSRTLHQMATAILSHPAIQPDISYAPDFAKYRARTKKRWANEKLEKQTLPAGFPPRLESDFVWDGDSVKGTYEWIYELNDKEVTEIELALEHFKCSCYTSQGQFLSTS